MGIDKNFEKLNNMFSNISKHYDFMNNVISLGLHKVIKKSAVNLLNIIENSKIIDICTGTGDLIKIILNKSPNAVITGLDGNKDMIEIAKSRYKKASFTVSDACNMPFENNSFDIATIVFGLRNIENRAKAIDEINRILKPQGQFLHVDFSNKNNIFSKFFDIFIPLITFFSKDYLYLVKSKNDYPCADIMIKEFESKGFKFLKRKDYLLGTISAQVMIKL